MSIFKNPRTFLALAGVFALLAALATAQTLAAATQTAPAVVAKVDLSAHAVVFPDQLAVIEIPAPAGYEDGVPAISAAAGQVTKGFIPAGTVVRRSMLTDPQAAAPQGQLSALSRDVEFTGFALPAEAAGVGGTVRQGDLIDLYGIFPARSDQAGGVHLLAETVPVILVTDGAVIVALTREDLGAVLSAQAGQAVLTAALVPPLDCGKLPPGPEKKPEEPAGEDGAP
jgi:Flp pilus assembly protein CpaB